MSRKMHQAFELIHLAPLLQITNRLLQLGVMLGTSLACLLMALAPVWPHLFSQDAAVVDTVEQLMPLAVAMLPVNALVYVLDGVLVGANDYQVGCSRAAVQLAVKFMALCYKLTVEKCMLWTLCFPAAAALPACCTYAITHVVTWYMVKPKC